MRAEGDTLTRFNALSDASGRYAVSGLPAGRFDFPAIDTHIVPILWLLSACPRKMEEER